jgi:hypothetical protein
MIWCDFIKYVFLVGYFNLALIIILNIASTDVARATSFEELIFGRLECKMDGLIRFDLDSPLMEFD